MLDLLTGLVDRSLVTTDDQGPETRYGLLETVRQYASARLAHAGETEGLRGRHLAYYLTLAQTAEPHVLGAGRDDPSYTLSPPSYPTCAPRWSGRRSATLMLGYVW